MEEQELEQNTDQELDETVEVEKHEGFVSDADNQAQVNKQHRKFRDAEREAATAKAEKESLQQQFDELQSKNEAITVPDAPDPYSETYKDDLAARDEAVRLKAEQDAQASIAESAKQRTEQAALETAQANAEVKIVAFDKRMIEHGLDPIEVKQAVDTLIKDGMTDTFQDILLEDPDGPLMVKYLEANPVETERLNGMSTLQLVNHLNTEIRPKASLLKPKTSDAPDPPRSISGGGAKETVHPALAGVKYS